jgi:hypothetical protein
MTRASAATMLIKQLAIPFASAILGGLDVFLTVPSARPVPRTIRADKLILADGIPRVIVSGGGDKGPSIILLDHTATPGLTLALPDGPRRTSATGQGGSSSPPRRRVCRRSGSGTRTGGIGCGSRSMAMVWRRLKQSGRMARGRA